MKEVREEEVKSNNGGAGGFVKQVPVGLMPEVKERGRYG